jgi:hypothetical protein
MGCDITDTVYVHEPIYDRSRSATRVASITGDHEVSIVWLGSTGDLAGYVVYRDDNADGSFSK